MPALRRGRNSPTERSKASDTNRRARRRAQNAPTQPQRSDPQHRAANDRTPDLLSRRRGGAPRGIGHAERPRAEASPKGGAARGAAQRAQANEATPAERPPLWSTGSGEEAARTQRHRARKDAGGKGHPLPAKIKTVAKMGHKTVTIITFLSQFFTNLSEMAHNVLKNLW